MGSMDEQIGEVGERGFEVSKQMNKMFLDFAKENIPKDLSDTKEIAQYMTALTSIGNATFQLTLEMIDKIEGDKDMLQDIVKMLFYQIVDENNLTLSIINMK